MRREFGDRKISQRTKRPEGDFGCKHFNVFLQLFYGNEANSNKPLKNLKNLWN